MSCSAKVMDEVYAAMPPGLKLRPSQVHKRQKFLALVTVRHALRQLCHAGRVTYEGADCSRLYMRKD